jgi:hypothetical protein
MLETSQTLTSLGPTIFTALWERKVRPERSCCFDVLLNWGSLSFFLHVVLGLCIVVLAGLGHQESVELS